MLVILIRTLIVFFALIIGLRLMGKRQIGELQPFEFVITLAVAELACTPMQDISIPLLYGIIPIFAVYVLHFFVTAIAGKNIKFRELINGKPIIIIDESGINYPNLKKLNMNINDLLESIRGQSYFSIEEIKYGIIETNGKLSVMKNTGGYTPTSIPLTLLLEGKFLAANMAISNTTKEQVDAVLKKKKLKPKDVLMLTTESNRVLVQPYYSSYFVECL